jgi:hypothetical protein
MTKATCTTAINIPADAVWRVISDFGVAGSKLPDRHGVA